MTGLVKRVNDRIEIREAGRYDRERGHHWVLAFISPNGSATLSAALGVEDMRQLREAMLDSRFLPPVDDDVATAVRR